MWIKESEIPILRNSLMFGETVDSVERIYRRKDGTIIPVQVKGWVIKNESGVPVQQGAFVKDISFRRKVEKLETSLIEKEKEQLEIELEAKNRELNSKIAQLIEKNGLVASAAEHLETLIANKPKKMEAELRKVIENLTQQNNEDFWRQFEITFEQINKSFYDNLYEKYPRLSSNEKKICALSQNESINKGYFKHYTSEFAQHRNGQNQAEEEIKPETQR
jgi:formyltetrahydrofolate hydrolase